MRDTSAVLYTTLLLVHILAVAVWLGGGVMLVFLVQRAARASLPDLSGVAGAATATGAVLGSSGGIALLAGIGLVLTDDRWEFEQAFVVIGVLVFLLVSAVGARVIGPTCERLAEAARSGDRGAVAPAQATLVRFSLLNVVLLVLAVAAMVYKWGA